jgi:hypothetical protein
MMGQNVDPIVFIDSASFPLNVLILNLFMLFMILLMLNLLIALMNDSFGKVKEKGLTEALNGVGEFLINTKKLINNISSKVIGVTYSLLDILGFALLLNPTMNIVNDVISDENITSSDTNRLLSGAAFATVVYGLKSVMSKIKKTLKED